VLTSTQMDDGIHTDILDLVAKKGYDLAKIKKTLQPLPQTPVKSQYPCSILAPVAWFNSSSLQVVSDGLVEAATCPLLEQESLFSNLRRA
jgi:hypothetical protein